MERIKKAIERLMAIDWSHRNSLCECVYTKHNGDIDEFINSEWHCVKDNCLHLMWYDQDKTMKVSYDLN